MFLSRFDGQSKLLIRSLMCGPFGAYRALSVVHRQQRANPDMSLCHFVETLCGDEINCTDTDARPVDVKPLVCLFPPLFKQNLLSFIHLVHSALPQTSVLRLLNCLSQDLHPNHWVSALSRQLERSLSDHSEEPLYTPLCSQRLQDLSQRLVGFGETRGWKCLSRQSAESVSQSGSGLSDLVKQKKRKGSFVTVDSDEEEMGQQSKKIKMNVCGNEHVDAENWSIQKETSRAAPGEIPDEEMQQAPDSLCDALPERIKVTILQIQELLESQTEWDQSSTDVFKVLSDCDPNQVEVLCSKLNLPDLPEQTLPKLCSSIVALCPDLSFSTAATLIKSLLLEKVLSLSESASRCLVTTGMSLCNHYPRPMCHALIRPVLEEKNIGNPQAELLNRMINDCMDSHYRLLVLQMTFKVAWSEAVLSIIHSLFDSKPDLNEELFTQFTEELVSQGPQFTKSVKFAKVMLTVLTKYNSHMTAAHKHSLNGCLVLNETFLKKSLQTALKRITPTH
ncbi:Fanconi anemia group E protein [Channa argus]|uniref:Fanconi anemia group E protein n=1 Tax=Channa argus TaxID=215402 RepID=A0A6G1Q2R9_CHAAH|nr:Fanconi anemia group E protein [Channa argus]